MNYGVDQCYVIYFGTGVDRYSELWARLFCFTNRIFYYGLRIGTSPTQGNGEIYLGVDSSQNYGIQANQCADNDNASRGLVISDDGNTLTFNG
ncbi:MAG: hypothetical protein EZS28_034752 [Streblomastix strix]|uniref:Uncharacterized protein n=1 Tax=Streblomastix strix TaxID=222440 RepID=A0A5J4UI71_9EUKA|nr:MAG: hypothetical protein EZS28_034752 [Streblomastix strix]